MRKINPELLIVDVTLEIRANDMVNATARTNKHSPIGKTPIFNSDPAHTVRVTKYVMKPGIAGIDN